MVIAVHRLTRGRSVAGRGFLDTFSRERDKDSLPVSVSPNVKLQEHIESILRAYSFKYIIEDSKVSICKRLKWFMGSCPTCIVRVRIN